MSDFWKDTEIIINESRIKVPYSWQAGETASHFLIQLRDEKKILGKRCPKCEKVLIPPRKTCPFCFVETDTWIEVSDSGTVESFTVVYRDTHIQPKKAPFIYAVIRLDGADTSIVHVLGDVDPDQVIEGIKVKAVFAEERKGSLLDILHFKPVTL